MLQALGLVMAVTGTVESSDTWPSVGPTLYAGLVAAHLREVYMRRSIFVPLLFVLVLFGVDAARGINETTAGSDEPGGGVEHRELLLRVLKISEPK